MEELSCLRSSAVFVALHETEEGAIDDLANCCGDTACVDSRAGGHCYRLSRIPPDRSNNAICAACAFVSNRRSITSIAQERLDTPFAVHPEFSRTNAAGR